MLNRLEKWAEGMVGIIDNHMRVVKVHDILSDQVFTEPESDMRPVEVEATVTELCAPQQNKVRSLNVRLESR